MNSKANEASRQSRVTLHGVAAAAGVSKSTVSRILDERLPRSENETAQARQDRLPKISGMFETFPPRACGAAAP